MPRKTLLIFTVIYLLAIGIYFIWSVLITEPGYPLDDSWIHQVFARNIVSGHGFSFNPGQQISGATAPLWTLVMAAVWPVTGPVAGGLLLGALLMWLALVAVYKITFVLTEDRELAFLVLLISSICWTFIWGALSGMEVGLYSALSLWGLYFYLTSKTLDDMRNYLAYSLFALAFLSRPECALFLAAAVIRDLIEWFKLPRKIIVPWLLRGAIVLILLAPYFAFNYSVTGSPFPQTYAAKVLERGLIPAVLNGDFKRVVKTLSFYPYLYLQDFMFGFLKIAPLLLLSFLAGVIKFAAVNDQLKSKRIMLLTLLLLYVPLMGTFAPVLSATYHNMRLVDNIIPLIFMIGMVGFFWRPTVTPTRHRTYFIIMAALLGIIGGFLILANSFVVKSSARYLLQDFSRFTARDFDIYVGLVSETGRNLFIIGFIFALGAVLCSKSAQNIINRKAPKMALIGVMMIYMVCTLTYRAPIYANDVKNINEIDKAVGIFLGQLDDGHSVGVGDIGAIGYYSGMRILDLKGLISPQLSTAMLQSDSLAFEYMLHHDRVDYLAVFPAWFRYITTRTDMLEPIKYFVVTCNTILADDTTIVYKANWPDSIPNTDERHR